MSEIVKVENVSDTALWVANYRAQESMRPDGLFKDPLAEKLVGERGKQLAALLGSAEILSWIMVVRTVAIDRLILKAIELGVDTIVNLGAGLDTRPYRMNLPTNLRWVEIDFEHMIQFKNEKLIGEIPKCSLERISVDLSKINERREVFKKLGLETKSALIITEGVIPYLSNEDAESLAKDIFAVANFKYWIQDFRNGGLKKRMPKRLLKKLKGAPFLFKAEKWIEFFENLGWKVMETISALDEGERLGRPFPIPFPWNIVFKLMPGFMKAKALEELRAGTGFVLFQKQKK